MGTDPSTTALLQAAAATPVQEHHYVRHELTGDGPAGTVQAAYVLTVPVSPQDLRAATTTLIGGLPSLRTRFAFRGTGLVQLTDQEGACDWQVRDHPGADDEAVADWLFAQRAREFDLHDGPLVRAALLRTDDARCVLALTAHRAVTDRHALDTVARRAVAVALGADPATHPLDDVPGATTGSAAGDEAADRAFWTAELAGDLPRHALAREEADRHTGPGLPRTVSASLPAPDLERLAAVCAREGVTLGAGLLAAYTVLVNRYSATDDVLVHVRPREDLPCAPEPERLVRTGLTAGETFPQLLRRIGSGLRSTARHATLPVPCVLREAGLVWPGDQDAVLPVSFTAVPDLDERHGAAETDSGIRERLATGQVPGADPYPTPTVPASGVWLTVRRGTDGPVAVLDGPLSYAWRTRFLGHYATLLSDLAADPDRPVAALRVHTPAESARLQPLPRVPGPADSGPPAHELFARHAARRPDRIAVTFRGEHLTYGELEERANRLAQHLRAAGVGRGTLVGLGLPRSFDLVVGVLAVHKAGGAYVPLDPAYPDSRLAYIVEDTGLAFAVVRDEAEAARHRDAIGTVVALEPDRELIAARPPVAPPPVATQDDLAYVIHTSGSTGRPKGTLVDHRNLSRLFTSTATWFSFGPEDVWTLFHSYAFDFSVWELWGALRHGGRLVVVPGDTARAPGEFHRLLREEGVTVLNQTPSAFSLLMHADREWADGAPDGAAGLRLRQVVFGGEALDPRALRPWVERHGLDRPRLVNMYGITETTVHVTYHVLTEDDLGAPGPAVIGEAIPDLSLSVLDAQGQPVPEGVPGELYVSGAGVARGYLKRPDLQAERFLTHPADPRVRVYRTGDVVRRRADGALEYRGRSDDQVKIRGFRIEPGEIAAALVAQSDVRDATVVVRDTGSGRELVAYAVPARPGATADAIRAALAATVPAHLVPHHVVLLDSFPLTSNGKVDKARLPAPGQPPAPSGPTERYDEMEARVAAVWAEVLELPHVGLDDNYFTIGGDSIRLVTVLSRSQETGLAVELPDLLVHQTVRELAAHLVRAQGPTA
ncbi:amino acid adenylation domain-containing protein [Streptomyces sp. NPDC001941]|uniref:non-ribosomal peptide synthetase n=1 Tax=Streptomyces sp. NPDC001941 TaxID=3154659 RepID=UPI0033279BB3